MAISQRRIILYPFLLAVLYSLIWSIMYMKHCLTRPKITLLRNSPLMNAAAAVVDNLPTGKSETDDNSGIVVQVGSRIPDLPSPIDLWTPQEFQCLGWKQTSNCDPNGPREPSHDKTCNDTVSHSSSGYCEFANKTSGEIHKVALAHCGSSGEDFKCGEIAMEFANYRLLSEMKMRHPENLSFQNVSEYPTRGIVIAAYKEVLINAFVNIKLLRYHGCVLPIELWFKTGELSPKDPLVLELTNKYNVVLRIIREEAIKKWLVKVYSIVYSHFDEVLLLDADNVPAVDPTYLFDLDEFRRTGAIFWPDYWRPGASIFDFNENSMIWELFGIPPIRMFEQESGQVLINRKVSSLSLNILLFYSYHFELVMNLRLIWGDKDLFRLAWLKTNQTFHMIERPPGSAGLTMDELFCGVTMIQHDTKGFPVFFHRNTIKFNKDSGNKLLWTHLQQYVGANDFMEFSVENTIRKQHAFGPFDCFGAYRYNSVLGTDGSRKFVVTDISETPFANLESQATHFAREGRSLSGEVL